MPYRVTTAAQHAGRELVRARAAAKAADLAPIVKEAVGRRRNEL
jgi:hypothetical protein